MTYSIVARDTNTGAIGIAVASRFFACGALVPFIGPSAAIATQAFVNPVWGSEGLRRLEAGESAQAVLDDLISRDEGASHRQAHLMDRDGRFAVHTGADCIDWAGHVAGEGFTVAGNMLEGPAVVEETARVFAKRRDLGFAERLLTAMDAGEAAGGDKRGRQAAGLRIHRGEAHPWLDLRVDDDADPLAELRRLLDVASEQYLHFYELLPTAAAFSGNPERAEIERRVAEDQAQRKAENRPSQSRATSKG
ncbi:Uncharacterized conserved protein, Ntn-hydrolase superfamily [Paracoccus isoporae]|uniref:Uncharacterized conserved protein, Ntn-hydrolase superfamily n=1 Tax=Paracoccus isoporae TaxID=591205 RepID=A0A1G6ZJN6_9RHOB|nr:DUF1028 domain-containing protein [Paracoccus isoporae]SDE02015.1 Uncharacterized conserved protein, Ntn-hydrolase superfamily [Paracoccus isoporae]